MLYDFISNLFQGRPLLVGPPKRAEQSELDEALRQIEIFEADWKLELPGDPISLSAEAALWSANSLYLASSLVVYRDSDSREIDQWLGDAPPDCSLAESHYAVDLAMRFLPDVFRHARSASTEDPLLNNLVNWSRMWPLSSVGIKDIGEVDATPLRTSETLMRLYVERVLATGDTERLNDPAVRMAASALLGHYPELDSNVANR